jgi:glycosyltransferase involved in cell wall biosynthesis
MHVLMNALQAGNRSGTGRYVVELCRALAQRQDLSLSIAWPQSLGAPDFPAGRVIPRADDAWSRIMDDQLHMPRLAGTAGAQLMHYPANVGPVFGRTPYVLTVHDLSFIRHPDWFLSSRANYYRSLVPRTARRAARVIAVSEHARQDLVELAGIDPDRIDVVHNGVLDVFRPATIEAQDEVLTHYNLPERYFVFAGTLEPRKNLPRLIRAWDSTADEHPYDLVLIGREGWKMQELQMEMVRAKHRARIHMLGHVPEPHLIALISAGRAFLWPSLFEGFGLPPVEAMACGCPVLTSNTSAMPEVCGDAAILVDPRDVDAMAAGIRRFAADHRFREDYRLRGRARAQKFTWARAAEKTAETYTRALG